MFLAKVVGNVVSTHKDEELIGKSLLLVKKVNERCETKGDEIVAIDFLGAGTGDIVIVVKEGSVAQQLLGSKRVPVHTIITGIVDKIDLMEDSDEKGFRNDRD